MDTVLSARFLDELGMDDYKFIHECHINSLADFTAQNISTSLLGADQSHNHHHHTPSFSSESYSSYTTTFNTRNDAVAPTLSGSSSHETSQTSFEKRPNKQHKSNSHQLLPQASISSSPTSQILSFETSASGPTSTRTHFQNFNKSLDFTVKLESEAALISHDVQENMQFQSLISKPTYENQNDGTKKRPYSVTRTPSHAQDHIMAERKRREKLSQRFIALSAIVPGLKKMDKASVLGDAIKYVKQLEERVKELEEQTKRRTVESVVFVKKSQVATDDESSSSDEDHNSALPEIEARVSDNKDVLIRIHCEKQRGVVVKIMDEIENNLHLSIVNSSALPFGNSTLDITIIAQMGAEFSMTVKDIVKNLRLALLKFM